MVPEPRPDDGRVVRAAVELAIGRMQKRPIDLLQFHWWSFRHPGWLDAMRELAKLQEAGLISHLGTTNFDTDHLHVLAAEGIPDRDEPGLLLAA